MPRTCEHNIFDESVFVFPSMQLPLSKVQVVGLADLLLDAGQDTAAMSLLLEAQEAMACAAFFCAVLIVSDNDRFEPTCSNPLHPKGSDLFSVAKDKEGIPASMLCCASAPSSAFDRLTSWTYIL